MLPVALRARLPGRIAASAAPTLGLSQTTGPSGRARLPICGGRRLLLTEIGSSSGPARVATGTVRVISGLKDQIRSEEGILVRLVTLLSGGAAVLRAEAGSKSSVEGEEGRPSSASSRRAAAVGRGRPPVGSAAASLGVSSLLSRLVRSDLEKGMAPRTLGQYVARHD